jgi:putative transposase
MSAKPMFRRKSLRLKGFDYSEDGAYFVTVCTEAQKHWFGRVDENGEMHCNQYGKIVWECWLDLPKHYFNMELDLFVVMPNHVHGIIFINNYIQPITAGEGLRLSPTLDPSTIKRHGIPEFVRALKSFSSRRMNPLRGKNRPPIWQRTYWDNIIRNETMLNEVRQYTLSNPAKWAEDRFYSEE